MPGPGPLVWVTRTEPGAGRTAARLRSAGFTPWVAPLLRIEDTNAPLPADFDGILFTSQNAVRAVSALTSRREAQVWCVGDATASAARASGFYPVISANGDVAALAERFAAEASRSYQWLYACAAEPRAPLASLLKARGFCINSVTVYETRVCWPKVTPEVAQSLWAVLIHSPRAGAQWANGLTSGRFGALPKALTLACLSDACAETFSEGLDLDTRMALNLIIATQPTEAALISCLQSENRPPETQ